MEAKKTQVYNLIILDKSGSMDSIRAAAINGYNETLGAIKAAQLKHNDTQEHFISLAAFCSCGVDMIYDCTPINEATKLTKDKYNPCCLTPLYDAIGITVKALSKKTDALEDAAVLVTIITDGAENASAEWSGQAVKALIDERKEEGWMFSYIGADHDVESAAASISITNTVVWDKSEAGTTAVIDNENDARSRFYDKVNLCGVINPFMQPSAIKKMRKQFAEEYYKE
ncbi:MAG: VWA domain-containing protein [Rikenellaceae bacterium]|nr:VWA domain-containing protein [Rikenellaceae bacterium]